LFAKNHLIPKQRVLIAFESTSQTIPSIQQAFHFRRFGEQFFMMGRALGCLNNQNLIYTIFGGRNNKLKENVG
jgi:hypothetical protein